MVQMGEIAEQNNITQLPKTVPFTGPAPTNHRIIHTALLTILIASVGGIGAVGGYYYAKTDAPAETPQITVSNSNKPTITPTIKVTNTPLPTLVSTNSQYKNDALKLYFEYPKDYVVKDTKTLVPSGGYEYKVTITSNNKSVLSIESLSEGGKGPEDYKMPADAVEVVVKNGKTIYRMQTRDVLGKLTGRGNYSYVTAADYGDNGKSPVTLISEFGTSQPISINLKFVNTNLPDLTDQNNLNIFDNIVKSFTNKPF